MKLAAGLFVLLLPAAALADVATQSASTNTVIAIAGGGSGQAGTTRAYNTPSVVTGGQISGANACLIGVGAGGAGGPIGFSITIGRSDEACQRRADASALFALGLKSAAIARMCQSDENRDAMRCRRDVPRRRTAAPPPALDRVRCGRINFHVLRTTRMHHADLGPSIRRQVITSRNGTILRDVSVVKETRDDPDNVRGPAISGMRVANPLTGLHMRSGVVTHEHMQAAERLTIDFEIGVGGCGAAPPLQRIAIPTGANPGMTPSERQLDALGRYRRALAAAGDEMARSVILHVVLGMPDPARRDVASWARGRGVHQAFATGILVSALSRIVGSYDREDGR